MWYTSPQVQSMAVCQCLSKSITISTNIATAMLFHISNVLDKPHCCEVAAFWPIYIEHLSQLATATHTKLCWNSIHIQDSQRIALYDIEINLE